MNVEGTKEKKCAHSKHDWNVKKKKYKVKEEAEMYMQHCASSLFSHRNAAATATLCTLHKACVCVRIVILKKPSLPHSSQCCHGNGSYHSSPTCRTCTLERAGGGGVSRGGEECLFCTTQSYVHNARSRGRVPTKRSRGCARAALVQVETTTTLDGSGLQ